MSHRFSCTSLFSLPLSLALFLPLAGCNKSATPAPPAEQAAAPKKVEGAAAAFAAGQKAICPVTGEEFVVAASTVQAQHKGKHFAFCCAECKPAFDKDPDKYAKSN